MSGARPVIQIGVLLGAGPQLSAGMRTKLKSLLKEVFILAQSLLREDILKTDLDLIYIAEVLTSKLEDSDLTNAGRGSELSINGMVECDATMAICCREYDVFASCGAVPDLLNPISLCSKLVQNQLDPSPRSRSVPNFLVGSGAREYGLRLGLCRADLATRRAKETHQKYLTSTQNVELDRYTDTIGLILVHGSTICVCSSSGGPILKDPGRIGPAALFGCGSYSTSESASVCSGFGEDISSTRLAQVTAESDRDLLDILKGPWKARLQRSDPYFGVVRASLTSDGVAFEWQHTTEGMVCGFARVSVDHINHHLVSSTEPQGGGVRM